MHQTVLIPSLRFLFFFPCRNANVVVPLAFSIKSTKQRVPTTLFQQLRVAMACPKETAKEGREKDQGKKKKDGREKRSEARDPCPSNQNPPPPPPPTALLGCPSFSKRRTRECACDPFLAGRVLEETKESEPRRYPGDFPRVALGIPHCSVTFSSSQLPSE